MSDLPKIDIIIPAYKAQNTILRTLSSIAEQEILEDLEVTIVNDADGIGYKEFVDMFSPYMKVKEIVMEKNGGPGEARQYGIENTTNPFITFIASCPIIASITNNISSGLIISFISYNS